ncbi:MAG: SUMF1/EgtB/PvdO family nonheme iron enzyme [Deltaproteobacteria bacterium]|nr:SUMF1/EgtB/PvdO family nonheme iron enzyme [Deltaproteobacteria bacterium]
MAVAGWKALLALLVFPIAQSRSALQPDSVASGGARRAEAQVLRSRVVWLPAGRFVMGSDASGIELARRLCRAEPYAEIDSALCETDRFADEAPRHTVLVGGYGIDRTEVTNGAYRRCVRAGFCRPSRVAADDPRFGAEEQPVSDIAWAEAGRYCAWVGGRLPTEAEWERAARGPGGRRFPWGNQYNPRLANHGALDDPEWDERDGHRYAAAVGSYPEAASPYGLLDMAGNVWEWVQDYWSSDAYSRGPMVDPRGPDLGSYRVVRGGSWRFPSFTLRTTNRAYATPETRRVDIGFRCAYSPSR